VSHEIGPFWSCWYFSLLPLSIAKAQFKEIAAQGDLKIDSNPETAAAERYRQLTQ
jgi:hypothetical protein